MRIIYPLELKQKRREEGLTQKQLAKKAGLSQSLIAKVERGLIDPSFSSMVKLSQALDTKSLTAKDIMQTKIKWSTKNKKKDLALMKKHGLSQLVYSPTRIVSEKSMLANKEYDEVITIPQDTPRAIIEKLVEQGPILVVQEEQVLGIITISDLL